MVTSHSTSEQHGQSLDNGQGRARAAEQRCCGTRRFVATSSRNIFRDLVLLHVRLDVLAKVCEGDR